MEKNNFGIPSKALENEVKLFEELNNICCEAIDLSNEFKSITGVPEKYNGPKIVVYAGTKNRYDQMELAAKTLLSNGNIDKIFFFIEDDVFPRSLPDVIITVNITAQNYFKSYCPNSSSPWTYMAMIRLALPKILPMYDRVLWLDTDTLVVDDISRIFEAPLGDYYYFAGVKENRRYIQFLEMRKIETREVEFQAYPQTDHQDYYNSGVLLENLKLLRESEMCDRLIARINNFRSYFPDQNVINQLCRNRIYTLPHAYNWSYFTGDTDIPRIIHTSNGQPRPEIQEIIDMYGKISFEEIMENKNKKMFVYNPDENDLPEILEADEIVETNQSGSVHWN